jgi:hypothetical protein
VRSGPAATEPWKFYHLGDGYCTYDFFEQCQHRMACAKCDFYMPKESTAALLLEGKTHLLRLLQEIPLSDAGEVAIEDGGPAYENLLSKLAEVLFASRADTAEEWNRVGSDHICPAGTASFDACRFAKYRCRKYRARFTSAIITGTSTRGPITAANAAPELMPNTETAIAIASSKLFEAAVNESVVVFE